ncbi:MAG: heparin lyase I family protein [Actinomycetota bacterium]|nr:heparin lyase I family protein [Actinomycetota bacterium]
MTRRLAPTPRFPRAALLLAALALVATAGLPAPALAAPGVEAETLRLTAGAGRVQDDGSAKGGRSLLIWGDGVARTAGRVLAGAGRSVLVARARGEQCEGAPRMTVRVDGRAVLHTRVRSTSWRRHRVRLALSPGRHAVSVAFTNDHSSRTCDRNLVVDRVGFATRRRAARRPSAIRSGPGTVTWDGDFSHGLSRWPYTTHRERIAIVDDPILGSARKVARFTVRDGDTGPTANPRAQIEGPKDLVQGGEYWVGWSTLLPRSFPTRVTRGGWITLASVYGPPYDGAGPVDVRVQGSQGEAEIRWQRTGTYDWDIPWRLPLVRGRWVDYVWHVKLSRDPSVGFVETFANTGDGWRPLHARVRMRTADKANRGGPNNFRLSLYRMKGMFERATVYHASPKVGTSFAAVAPRSYG